MADTRIIEVEDRKFIIKKMSARNSLKLARMFASKLLPAFSPLFDGKQKRSGSENVFNLSKATLENVNDESIFEAIQKSLDALEDKDIDKVIDLCLMSCDEILSAGNAAVINQNGTYGVVGIEDDLVLIMLLVQQSLVFNFQGFFKDSRLKSLFSKTNNSPESNVKM